MRNLGLGVIILFVVMLLLKTTALFLGWNYVVSDVLNLPDISFPSALLLGVCLAVLSLTATAKSSD